jgi:hypothetical protein
VGLGVFKPMNSCPLLLFLSLNKVRPVAPLS